MRRFTIAFSLSLLEFIPLRVAVLLPASIDNMCDTVAVSAEANVRTSKRGWLKITFLDNKC